MDGKARRGSELAHQMSEPTKSIGEQLPYSAKSCIAIDHVSLTFRSGRREVQALVDINLDVAEGEFIALLGPTGCGKSSLLRLVSDLIAPTAGTIAVRGGRAAQARAANAFGFVFQEPALLSWRSALANVQLPLEVVDYPSAERQARCEQLLDSVGLLKFKEAYPHELSGGMKQRVAIVRALAWNPPILLMDEPFSALDELTRAQLQDDLPQLWSGERKTCCLSPTISRRRSISPIAWW
jgi:NitT/TauT family transport system ATP-binding protein